MYHSPYRPWRGVIILLFVFSLLCFGVFFTLRLEPVSRRVAMLPYYAETYIKKLRPDPLLPTPPAVSSVNTSALLQGYDAESQASHTRLVSVSVTVPHPVLQCRETQQFSSNSAPAETVNKSRGRNMANILNFIFHVLQATIKLYLPGKRL